MKQTFETADLKRALERSLGFELRSLTRLDGASAINFKAERQSDGLLFAVKCIPPFRLPMYEHLVRHLDELRGTKAVARLFESTCPESFEGYRLVCLEWCRGERRFPDRLTDAQIEKFCEDYLAFASAMQRASLIRPHDPMLEWRAAALKNCRGFWGRPLARLIERDLPIEGVTYEPARICTVHGDFHHGNFLFVNGEVAGYFDLEELCEGYPTDDLVRYFVCAAEHLRWYEQWRLRRTLAAFAVAVRSLPYSAADWAVAINCLLLRKLYFKTADRRPGFAQTVNLLYRARLYRQLKQIVIQTLGKV